jgi:hypothetical protein
MLTFSLGIEQFGGALKRRRNDHTTAAWAAVPIYSKVKAQKPFDLIGRRHERRTLRPLRQPRAFRHGRPT